MQRAASLVIVEDRSSEVDSGTATAGAEWQRVDRALRGIAKRRAGLDAEELGWLREAERLQIWRPLGMVSALDYMERVLGYTPQPRRSSGCASRARSDSCPCSNRHSAVASSVLGGARADTGCDRGERAAVARLRDRQDGARDRGQGRLPSPRGEADQPPEPEVRSRIVRLELSAETFARLRQARAALADEHGRHLADDELVTALCDAVLDGAGDGDEPSGRAKFQIAVMVCERCNQGWQEGAGATVPIDDAAVERAHCDAQHIGSLDADVPARAQQDIPPSVVRFVWRRDHGRCQTPGCRSARGLEIHHVVRRPTVAATTHRTCASSAAHATWGSIAARSSSTARATRA